MIDAVLSYHMNPDTCGVAKFNHALAKRLGVPIDTIDKHPFAHPLISVKSSETSGPGDEWPMTAAWYRTYDLFLHDDPHGLCCNSVVAKARAVYAANPAVAAYVRTVIRPDVIDAFCPSTVDGNPSRGAYRVLTFGMAHKLVLPHFQKLKEELDRDHPDYTIELSTAVHEGNPWDEALRESTEAMRAIFGDKLRVLGFLADDGLARVLQECDAVAAFYSPALRANNTTAWAALSAGKFLYTNLDAQSPELNPEKYSWDALIETIQHA